MECGLPKITFCGLVNSFWRGIINGACYLLERKHWRERPAVDAGELEICLEAFTAWHAIGSPRSGWIASRYLDDGTWAKCSRGRIVVYRPGRPAKDMTVWTYAQAHHAPLAIPAQDVVALQSADQRGQGLLIGVRRQSALPITSAPLQLPSPPMLLGTSPITPAEPQAASALDMTSAG
jgi:hypothetical protein